VLSVVEIMVLGCVREKKDMYTGYWWVDLRERDHLEDLCIDGRIILIWILNK
jgi:hypothetical protein